MSKERPLYDEVLDYALYAPVGLLLSVVEDLPGLVEKGRSKLAGRLGLANVVGKMAFVGLKQRVEHFVNTERSGPSVVEDNVDAVSDHNSPVPAGRTDTVVPHVSDLAIAGYDTLAASQIVARLEGLRPEELEQIRAYEFNGRARRTILLRIAQLESDDGDQL